MRAERAAFAREVVVPVQHFIHIEWVGSAFLLVAAIVALSWANSPWSDAYQHFIHIPLVLDIGFLRIEEDLSHLVNDGLMAIFFFVVGLEMKREVLHGGLSNMRAAALPIFGAIGGMVVPALLYAAVNPDSAARAGWGVPMATDIAFALGVVGLVGKGIPGPVRLFLLALAIVDDLGAILVIALFYTDSVSGQALLWAGGVLVVILGMQRAGVTSIVAYWIVGFFFWAMVLDSGIHATLAGVVMGAITPATPSFSRKEFVERSKDLSNRVQTAREAGDHDRAEVALGKLELITIQTESPLERLERLAHPWTAFVVLPIFALVNAGVEISADSINSAVVSTVTWGIVLGLLVGKLLGVTLFSWIAVKIGWAVLPPGVRWSHIGGAAVLAGIGFTMSIFITGLAYDDIAYINEAKMGVLAASLAAGVIGFTWLKLTTRGGAASG